MEYILCISILNYLCIYIIDGIYTMYLSTKLSMFLYINGGIYTMYLSTKLSMYIYNWWNIYYVLCIYLLKYLCFYI